MGTTKLDSIVIDQDRGLIFSDESQLLDYFAEDIERLEAELSQWRAEQDISEDQFSRYEVNLEATLNDPDEVWELDKGLDRGSLNTYIREFQSSEEPDDVVFHVAIVYKTGDVPSFVYLHFPTLDVGLIHRYQRGHLVYDKAYNEAPLGALDGDALLEGDELAVGLYKALLTVRSESDIPEEKFREYSSLREEAIEDADEIWRCGDSLGNILVTFIKEFPDQPGGEVHYVAVTAEDTKSNSHILLLSFPTKDKSLLTRYRHGENLQAEEVTQERQH